MKSQFTHFVLIAGLTLVGSLSLNAQDSNKAVATVPFSFQANHHSYTAGDYELTKLGTGGNFLLNDRDNGTSIFVVAPLMRETKKNEGAHLTFTCNGDDCVLSQIWLAGSDTGYVRSDSAIEKDMQRKLGMATMINVRLGK